MEAATGLSLFQGNDGIQLNTNVQCQEEEEAIEDERRRNEEIKNLLSTAFDDLSVDDDDDDDYDENDCNGGSNFSSFHNSNNSNNNGHSLNNDSSCSDDQNNSDCHVNKTNTYVTNNQKNTMDVNRISTSNVDKNERDEFHFLSSLDKSPNDNNRHSMFYNTYKKKRYQHILPNINDSATEEMISTPSVDADSSDNEKSSPHLLHCYRRTSLGFKGDSPKVLLTNDNQDQIQTKIQTEKEQRDAYIATKYNSVEQLQMLYEIRLKEIQSLKEELDKERKNSALLKDDLMHKMMIAEADKEGAILSYKQTNELLAWSKNKSSDLEREVTTLKQNIVNLEKTRSENIKELEAARGMITDLQQRLAFLERSDGTKQTERQLENTIKTLQSKHLQEVTTLNQQLENYNSKLKQKDEEIKKLEDRLSDIQGKLGSLIVEKSETITVLMKDLDESQAQCRQLMASNISHENVRLQQKLDDLIKEKEENNKTIDSLKSECNMLRNDLEQLESISHLGFTSASASDSMVQLGLTSKNGSNGGTDTTSQQQGYNSNLYLSDTNNRLKDELHRALLGQRTKRSEIKRLQEKLDRRENQISEMKKQERVYLAEVETLKSDMAKLLSELKMNSNSFEHKKPNKNDAQIQTSLSFIKELESERKKIDIIEKEKEALKLKLTETEKLLLLAQEKLGSNKETKNNYLIEEEIEKMVKRQVEAKEVEHRVVLEQKIKECNELKELYIQLRAEKDSLNKQLEVEKGLNHDFSNQFKHFSTQIDGFKSEIKVKDELLSNCKADKEQLESKLNELKNSLSVDKTQETIAIEVECTRLKEEISSISKQHKNEIDRLKNELIKSEDRLIISEKKLRADFTYEINKKEKEIYTLNVLIQDKELKLKETLDNLNKYISIKKENKSVMTEDNFLNYHELETKMWKDYEERLQNIIEQHSKDLKLCEEECTKKIISMEEMHKEALRTVVNQNKNEILKSEEKQRSVISALKKQLIDQEQTLKANYIADLISAEEKVKDITVKYFAEEIKKIENRHRSELEAVARQLNSSPVETLKSLLADKENEIENLKLLKPKYLEAEKKLAALENQIDMDRNNTAELMTRWAKEVQDLRSEMINNQAKMEEMKEKLKKLKRAALYFRQELILYKQNAATAIKKQQYKLLQELQDKIQHAFELDNKNEIKLMEKKYAVKEQELRKKLNQ